MTRRTFVWLEELLCDSKNLLLTWRGDQVLDYHAKIWQTMYAINQELISWYNPSRKWYELRVREVVPALLYDVGWFEGVCLVHTSVIRKACARFPGSELRAVSPDPRDPADPPHPPANARSIGLLRPRFVEKVPKPQKC